MTLARGEGGQLLGIPVTLKQPMLRELPTTFGYPQFRDFVPKEDALVTSRLKAAGAIVMGKINTPIALREWRP